MDSNKILNMSVGKLILVLILVGLMVTGGSYAYWMWASNVNKNVVFNTISGLEGYIIYDEGESYFVGNFQPTDTFCQNVSNTISFKKTSEVSELNFLATIYMDINSIGENIGKSSDVYWVVTEGDNSITCESGLETETVLSYGTFNGAKSGDTIKLLDRIVVTEDNKQFTVWMWIDTNGTNLSSLSGETIDANVWTEFTMYDERGPKVIVNFDTNGGVLSEGYNKIEEFITYITPGEYKFTVPQTGEYHLELWGASGHGSMGGNGGYVSGNIELKKNTILNVFVGENPTGQAGGYNGGGNGYSDTAGGGGGATDIRIDGAELNHRIMVAGGGGGHNNNNTRYTIGDAGGLIGYTASDSSYSAYTSTGGTQTSGGIVTNFFSSYTVGTNGEFGLGGSGGGASGGGSFGGGGGYYGGDGGGHSGNGAARITFLGNIKKIKYGDNYGELPTPIREGYVFEGWYTEDGVKVTEDTVLENRDDHTLYAKWSDYVVTFLNSGVIDNANDYIIASGDTVYSVI